MPLLPLVRLTLFLLLVFFQDVQTFKFPRLTCYLPGYECCAEPYVKFDTAVFRETLESKLFGQHLVPSTVIAPLRSHLEEEDPQRPLIFFFHGGPGTGKTYVAKMLLNATFSRGIGSRFVRIFFFGTTFPKTIKETELVESVHFEIWSRTKSCERSMFVFDGYDPVWTKVLEALKLKDETLYKETVFIFIAGIGTNSLDHHVFQEHQKGRAREDLTAKELLNVAKARVTAETGALFKKVLSWDRIVYVPFLPLTRAHVMQCVELELKKQKSATVPSKEIFAEIISEADGEFVVSGCKRVSEKTLYTLGRHKDEL